MSVTIGPEAAKPLHLKTPIIVSGMAYGYALSEAFKIALAKGLVLQVLLPTREKVPG